MDQFLAGQALQQRNKAASLAGQLFLQLAQTRLQQSLLDEAKEKLAELSEASRFVADRGFATAEADQRLQMEKLKLDKQLVELESAQAELQVKLNGLLGIGLCCPKSITPQFELAPAYEELDVCAEITKALHNRPDLNNVCTDECGCISNDCFQIISQLDPRLGLGVSAAIKRCSLIQSLFQQKNCECEKLRSRQLQELRTARRDLVRTQVAEAVLDIQKSYKRLVLENQELAELRKRSKALEIASELKPLDSFVERIENWAAQMETQSERFEHAFQYEIAKLKLLESTGEWTDICGLTGACSAELRIEPLSNLK